jgi:methionyl-tRNA formyltransferase
MAIAVAATAPFGAAVLEGLARRHEVEVLLTRPDRPRGRGRRVGPPPAKIAAERLGIAVLQPERLDTPPGRAPVVVVCAYGVLIPEPLLAERLWLNVHPSLLPRWRGAAPVERAIMAGDTQTGVTIHRTTAELDAGPIAAQRSFPIGDEDDAGAVYARASAVAVELLDELLDRVDALEFVPQPEEGVTYAERIRPADRQLDLSQPAREIVNRVRALSPHIGARAVVGGRVLTVWRARPAAPDSVLVAGPVELLEVQPEGRRRMTGAEYLRGLRGNG